MHPFLYQYYTVQVDGNNDNFAVYTCIRLFTYTDNYVFFIVYITLIIDIVCFTLLKKHFSSICTEEKVIF